MAVLSPVSGFGRDHNPYMTRYLDCETQRRGRHKQASHLQPECIPGRIDYCRLTSWYVQALRSASAVIVIQMPSERPTPCGVVSNLTRRKRFSYFAVSLVGDWPGKIPRANRQTLLLRRLEDGLRCLHARRSPRIQISRVGDGREPAKHRCLFLQPAVRCCTLH